MIVWFVLLLVVGSSRILVCCVGLRGIGLVAFALVWVFVCGLGVGCCVGFWVTWLILCLFVLVGLRILVNGFGVLWVCWFWFSGSLVLCVAV